MTSVSVKVIFDNKSTMETSHATNRENARYVFKSGDMVIVQPPNLNKLKHRGRIGRLTGGHNKTMKARVQFTDEQGGYGYVEVGDLRPAPKAD